MTFDHGGRIAFITGSGSGIGRATAMRLASEGARVAVIDLRLEAALETAHLITETGGRARAFAADVRDRAQIEAARDGALETFGAIHYLVNNAGLVRMSALDDLAEEDPGEPLIGEHYEDPVPPLPVTLGEAVERFRDSAFAQNVLGADVVAHYTEAGRWEWEQFLAPGAVTEWERRRYFEVI